ncbi:MotA/TolQ/ExbB proton channel family protein [Candidatus Cloacimonas acidaminovorans]|jgi:biopolymer transport protein ExbB|uniref:MotA/TolQ/ExbB proton channel family protein (Modular protein) n=1 Tax=Cloacimonas acidaminovorans (strain Evry) TaxID=459349 RepID=B0VGQ6_CLOAI|nr:MotA/TolQ/ExbB proton channel family protein [Candidatus Cloacimonas acidaminovorans]CAO80493.1 MotA/TolQ/ExbB proton channel family protein (modular protein) [Candidatus Cloacimonas acidaminovorans str. Evry]HNV61318.1 MotA/TolQ/ExbB proton channel family protein [Candidatus Cloacimonas acidaminovorans]
MRKFIGTMLLIMMMTFVFASFAYAQEKPAAETEGGGLQNFAELVFGSGLVKWFKDGGWAMWPILFLAIYGLAYIIWKFIALLNGKINLNTFLDKIIPLIKEKKFEEAKEIAKNTRGPIAAIIYAGLEKVDKGMAAVDEAIENASMIEMSYLEKGFIELSSSITLAPMLGFLGTVAGMITAFESIAAARAVDATIVATGIRIALITTEAGLIVAIPVQFFNNVFMTMVDGIVIDMQRASEKFTETLAEEMGITR